MMAAIARPVGATYGRYWGFDVLHSGGARCIWRIRWESEDSGTGA